MRTLPPTRAFPPTLELVPTPGAGLIRIESACVSGVPPSESVQLTVKLEVPMPEGVPLIVATDIDKPAGNEPTIIEQAYGGVPPVIVMV